MKSSPTPPTPPDPVATAAAQTASNKETAGYQQSMNMINQNTPLGSLTYNNIGTDPTTGAPRYEADVGLTPTGQKSFDLQQATGEALNNLALQGTGNVSQAMGQAQSYSGLPTITPIGDLPGYDSSKFGPAPTANQADYDKAQTALLDQYKMTLDPQWTQQETDLRDSLAQKGIVEGSDAYNKAINNFQTQKTQAYQSAMNNSVTGASSLEAQQFAMGSQAYQTQVANALNANQVSLTNQQAKQQSNTTARQQGITEANYLRELPINEVSALLHGGEVSQPSFTNTPQTSVQPTNVAGITQASFQDAQQNYQAQMQQQNAMIGAVFGAAGSALGGWASAGFV